MLGPSDFEGNWVLDRRLTDHLGQMNGVLAGQATWTPRGGAGLTYSETGTLTLAQGGTLAAVRQYLWKWERGEIAVFFQDGAPFHRFRPEGRVEGTTHLCGLDTYVVAYDFTAWPRWTATWRVTGPRKDYISLSAYAPGPLA